MSGAGQLAPVDDAEREIVLDALRGFALLGIFLSHLPGFSGYEFMPPAEQAALDHFGIDAAVSFTAEFLISGKFFSLFSLLFGIGFAIQLESARRRGARVARHFARRLAILFGIGVVHGLIWYGDILRDYAWLGLLLIPSARWSSRSTALAAAGVLLARAAWPFLIFAVAAQLVPFAEATAPGDPTLHFFERTRAFAQPDWLAGFHTNLELLRIKALQLIYEGKAVSILGMFLVGAFIGKSNLHRHLATSQPALKRCFLLCAPVGIVGNALLVPLRFATPDYPPTLAWVGAQVLYAVAVPALTLAYASGFALLWTRPAGVVLRALAPAGRMALTTYVSQTLLGVGLFYGVGLGLRGHAGAADCVLIALALFSLQCAASALWLRRFRFGPLEWCWRRGTYGVPLVMLRS